MVHAIGGRAPASGLAAPKHGEIPRLSPAAL